MPKDDESIFNPSYFSNEMNKVIQAWTSNMMLMANAWLPTSVDIERYNHSYQLFQKKIMILSEAFIKNLQLPKENKTPLPTTDIKDRRFYASEWNDQGFYEYLYKSYQLTHQYLSSLIGHIKAPIEDKNKISFLIKHYLSAIHPANFPATNPEYWACTLAQQGNNLYRGLATFLDNIQKKYITQTDESVFHIGENIASTPGHVVFRNQLIELIYYTPTTLKQYQNPILFIPPCINKYYILDISRSESFAGFMVNKSFPTYMISWKNIDESLKHMSWDDYVLSVIEAITFIYKKHNNKIHIISYCIGSIISLTTANTLKSQKKEYIETITMMATLLDYTHPGDMIYFFPEASHIEQKMHQDGIIFGEDLRTMYSLLRPEDLIWPYVTDNYLLGKTPPAFDILYWSNDAVNLSQRMLYFFLHHGYMNNNFTKDGSITVCDAPLMLKKLNIPTYFFVSEKDHITPWKSGAASLAVLNEYVEYFVLGSSGHTRGVIPPQDTNKTYYRATQNLQEVLSYEDPDEWKKTIEKTPGSWWIHLTQWLISHTKTSQLPAIEAQQIGEILCKSPGTYVCEKTVMR